MLFGFIRNISPHKCLPIFYGTKAHLTSEIDTSALLDADHKHCIQDIVGSVLYYTWVVDCKLLVAPTPSAISAQQAQATIATEQALELLLDYVATNPNDGIVYQSSNIILSAHIDTRFLNETKIPSAELVPTSSSQRMIHSHGLMLCSLN